MVEGFSAREGTDAAMLPEQLPPPIKQRRAEVLTKIDRLPDKRDLLARLAQYRAIHEFAEFIPVSAWTGDGMDELVVARLTGGAADVAGITAETVRGGVYLNWIDSKAIRNSGDCWRRLRCLLNRRGRQG